MIRACPRRPRWLGWAWLSSSSLSLHENGIGTGSELNFEDAAAPHGRVVVAVSLPRPLSHVLRRSLEDWHTVAFISLHISCVSFTCGFILLLKSHHNRTISVSQLQQHRNNKCELCDFAAAQNTVLKNHVMAIHINKIISGVSCKKGAI